MILKEPRQAGPKRGQQPLKIEVKVVHLPAKEKAGLALEKIMSKNWFSYSTKWISFAKNTRKYKISWENKKEKKLEHLYKELSEVMVKKKCQLSLSTL